MDRKNEIPKISGSPFDDSATERHYRMGLTDAEGGVSTPLLEAAGRIHAGLFFDHLCDACDDYGRVLEISGHFLECSERNTARRMLLMLSVQYDIMRLPLPELIWWISGRDSLLEPFISAFIRRLRELSEEYGEGCCMR